MEGDDAGYIEGTLVACARDKDHIEREKLTSIKKRCLGNRMVVLLLWRVSQRCGGGDENKRRGARG